MTLAPDLATRVGWLADRSWAVNTNLPFHWRFRDNRQSILAHSSWRYQDDIKLVTPYFTEKPGRFVSDPTTSYYFSAESGIPPLVQHQHHSTSGSRFNEQFRQLCDQEIDAADWIETFPQRFGARYVLINKDKTNYTAEVYGRSCVGHVDHLTAPLSTVAERVYQGEYLDLWRVFDNTDNSSG